MPHELEYIVDQAVCHCDKGAAPNFFKGLANQNVKINGCMACTKADKIPLANIPSFGVCSVTGGTCTPAPTDWTDTYKVKIKGKETLLFKSKLPCSVGGKIEFMTSGQVPVSQEDLDKMTGEHSEQEKEEDGLSWWDAVEMVPFIGGVVGIVRSGMKDPTDWLGVGLSVASLALDVGGLFSFGAGNAASAGVKAGKLARAGAKVIKAANKVKKAAKLTKLGAKALGKSLAKHVDDIAMATGKVCVFACFPAGTKVHTASGQKNIEDIAVGDEVWAWDEESGTIALKSVTATMQSEVDATVEITLEGETIETTAEHPFYTREGWKDAADLTETDEIKTKTGEWKFIKEHKFAYQKRKVFNFEVEDWHTYFVGVLAWLVHNAAKCVSEIVTEVGEAIINKVHKVSKAKFPNHTKMLENAVEKGHSLKNLKRGKGTKAARKNRYESQKAVRKKQGGPKKDHDYDEFPYASTEQGGKNAHVEEVLSDENQAAGRELGDFYRENGIKHGDIYDVEIID